MKKKIAVVVSVALITLLCFIAIFWLAIVTNPDFAVQFGLASGPGKPVEPINTAPTEQEAVVGGNLIAAHFYLDGKGYFHNGKLTYELPEGYEYVGDVINVGDTLSGKDFEGNVDGKIYMNQSVSDTAYFSWAEWNEEIDGATPFLKLELKKSK